MRTRYLWALLLWLLPAVLWWLLPSIYALTSNDPDLFQRMGGVLIVWAVVSLAAYRPLIEKLTALISQIEELSTEVESVQPEMALQQRELDKINSELSEIWKRTADKFDAERTAEEASDTSLPRELISKAARLQVVHTERTAQFQRLRQSFESASGQLNRHKRIADVIYRTFVAFEVLLFSIGTIQSSFGDWAVCSFHAGYFNKCSS